MSHLFDVLELYRPKRSIPFKQQDTKQPNVHVYSESSQAIKISTRDLEDTILMSHAQTTSPVLRKDEMDACAILQNVSFDFSAETLQSTKARMDWGHLYLVSLVGKTFEHAMIIKSGKRKLLTAGLLANTPQEQRRIICGPIFDRPDGLVVLYRMIIQNCKTEFLQLFTLIDKIAEYPIAYFCNHGKDRTGLTTVFLQSICGVDRETIISNYLLSDHFLRPLKSIVDYEMMDGGLTPDIMSRTPAFVLRATLEYIDKKYGSVWGYLNHIGLTNELLFNIQNRLVEFDSS